MPRYINKTQKSLGRAPDDIVFRGKQIQDETLIRVIDFDESEVLEDSLKELQALKSFQNSQTVTWLNVDGLHNIELLTQVGDVFGFDKMVLAEVLKTGARPRLIDFENCTLLSIKMLRKPMESKRVIIENVSIIVTKSILITFQEKKGDVFDPIRERIKKQNTRIRNRGVDYLAYALLDIVIDNYLYVLSDLGERIENLEDVLLDNVDEKVITQINQYKKELNFLRKTIKPAREMALTLSKLDSEFISEDCAVYFKELLGNVVQASEVSDSYRDILSDQLNIYHTTLSSKLNDVMKVLTVFSVVFIPLTFIAGIYGTNFAYIPELQYKYSYHLMWGVMIFVSVFMLLFFKRKGWL